VIELGQFELNRIDAGARVSVAARDMSALEAAIDDERVVALRLEHGNEFALQFRRATRTICRAEVEIRQASLEQPGHVAADRMSFPQDRATVYSLDPRNFLGERAVVRAPVALDAREDFVVRRFLPFEIHRRA